MPWEDTEEEDRRFDRAVEEYGWCVMCRTFADSCTCRATDEEEEES